MSKETVNTEKQVYLDFDGTIVEHRYPEIGLYNDDAMAVIKQLLANGWTIYLNTTRIDLDKKYHNDLVSFNEAFDYLKAKLHEHNIVDINTPVYPIKHTDTKYEPHIWDCETFKAKAVIYIDDMCHGIPLKPTITKVYNHMYDLMVDWEEVEKEFKQHKII